MTVNHSETVRSLSMAGAFARFDAFARRGSNVRRTLVAESDRKTSYSCYACFLFSPRYARDHPEKAQEWIDGALAVPEPPEDRAIHLKRIDMIAAHDALDRLGEIEQPSLIFCSDHDAAAPLPHSEEIAAAIPGSELVVLEDAGHLIELEKEAEFFRMVSTFIDRQRD